MSQVSCPRCDETIRVPEVSPPADASARCPWCRETFSFGELESRLPPMLEWVGSDGETIPYSAGTLVGSSSQSEPALASAAAAGAGFAGANTVDEQETWSPELENDTESFSFADSDQPAAAEGESNEMNFLASSDASSAATGLDSSLPRTRPRAKKSASPLKTMIQMVLGGAVAIPLTGLILFGVQYMGWKTFNFGFWPFDGSGGTPNRTAAAPMDLNNRDQPQPAPRQLGDGEMPFGTMGGNGQQEDAFVPRSAANIDEIATPEPETPSAQLDGGGANEPDMSVPRLEVPELDDSLETGGDNPLEMPAVDIPVPGGDIRSPFDTPDPDAVAETAEMELPAPADAAPADPAPADAADPDSVTEVTPSAEDSPAAESPALEPPSLALLDSVEAARQLSTDLAEYEGDAAGRKNVLKNFYYALAEVGEQGQPSARAAYQSLFTQLRESGQLEQMAKFGSPWVAKGNLVKKGVFAAGTLDQQDGETVLTMAPVGGEPVSLPLEGWSENQLESEQWVGKEVYVLAKLEGPIGSRQGTVRYIEGQ
ncbi:hypothetical protein [Roseimaritima ulvae]|uniref:Uncharacterized protein n=1 Tax=Roseimaritima ulvae TaxID=980254 RepID=A0A5B9QNR3_9BACT|nr:hypothetical protein [Roseimaritima ulvae]QEG40614.1 hypothetical protein UC8_26300 [Roseimaritima ulvae]